MCQAKEGPNCKCFLEKEWNLSTTTQPYFASKALSEKKAFELAKEYNLNLVTLLPTLVTGPFLLDKIPNSVADAISLRYDLTQKKQICPRIYKLRR